MPEKDEKKIVKVKMKAGSGKRLGINNSNFKFSIVQGEIKELPYDIFLDYSGKLMIAKVRAKPKVNKTNTTFEDDGEKKDE